MGAGCGDTVLLTNVNLSHKDTAQQWGSDQCLEGAALLACANHAAFGVDKAQELLLNLGIKDTPL